MLRVSMYLKLLIHGGLQTHLWYDWSFDAFEFCRKSPMRFLSW